MTTHIPWPETGLAHNVRKYLKDRPEILGDYSKVRYKSKVKFHGTNAAVQVHPDGTIVAQSREKIITQTDDNAGFAKWAHTQTWPEKCRGYVIFGEWCGKGIMKGVAISQIPKKVFAIFAAKELDTGHLVFDPLALQVLLFGMDNPLPSDTHILEWHSEVTLDWASSAEALGAALEPVNQAVESVEAKDPWVASLFGVEGTGEGLVYYPVSHLELFDTLFFKAKGDKHKKVASPKAATVDPAVAASVGGFVDLVLTDGRLQQGAEQVGNDFDTKNMGKFLAWIGGDVLKETKDELTASGLTWDQVQKPVQNKARGWFLERARKL